MTVLGEGEVPGGVCGSPGGQAPLPVPPRRELHGHHRKAGARHFRDGATESSPPHHSTPGKGAMLEGYSGCYRVQE